jgi:hypothetical protein
MLGKNRNKVMQTTHSGWDNIVMKAYEQHLNKDVKTALNENFLTAFQ